MKTKKCLHFILSVALVLSSFMGVYAAKDYSGHWAGEAISALLEKGIISGNETGEVNPDHLVTRAEFVKMANGSFGFNQRSSENFSDVLSNSWYYNDFLIAKEAGYITGDSQRNANPEDSLLRGEISVILARILKLDSTNGNSSFSDAASIPDWAKGSVAALAKAGYIKGYEDGTFRAENTVTRAEAIYMLWNIKSKPSTPAATPAPEQGNTSGIKLENATGRAPSGGGGGGGGDISSKPKPLAEPIIRSVEDKKILTWEPVRNASSYQVKIFVEGMDPIYPPLALTNSLDIKDEVAILCEKSFDENIVIQFSVKANAKSGYLDSNYSAVKSFDKNIFEDFNFIDAGLKLNYQLDEKKQEKYFLTFDERVESIIIKSREAWNEESNVSGSLDISPYLIRKNGEVQTREYVAIAYAEDGEQVLYFSTGFGGGSGTKEDPYVVGSKRHFDSMYLYPSSHYVQTVEEIDIGTNFVNLYEKAGNQPFSGSYIGRTQSGEKATIKLNLTNATENASIFGVISQAEISNIKVVGTITTGDETKASMTYKNIGAIAGASLGNSVIRSCESQVNIFGGVNTGGIIGSLADGDLVENCTNYGNIETKFMKIGGIVGYTSKNTSVIKDCINYGSLTSTYNVAANLSADETTYQGIGGIVGHSAGAVENCVNEVGVVLTGEQAVGGIAGYFHSGDNKKGLSHNVNKGQIVYDFIGENSFNPYLGGIVGYMGSGIISNCVNEQEATITATAVSGAGLVCLGGIAGFNAASVTISNSFNKGNITGFDSTVIFGGGIVGYNFGNIEASANYSNGLSSRQVGGIVGRSDSGTISKCFNTGNLPATAGYKGGIASVIRAGTIENTFNLGEAKALHSGGITGSNGGTIKNSYSVVHGTSVNPISDVKGTQSEVYYILAKDAKVTDTANGGILKTTSELIALPTGLQDSSVWRVLGSDDDSEFPLPQLVAIPYLNAFDI